MEENKINENTKNKKGNGGLIALIIVLILCLLGTTGYIVIDKTGLLNSKEETKTEEKNETKQMTNEEAIALLKKFDLYNEKNYIDYYIDAIYKKGMTEDKKSAAVLDNISDDKKQTIACDDVYSESDLDEHGRYKVENGYCFKGKNTKMIKYSDYNEVYKKMFGNDKEKKGFYADFNYSDFFYAEYNDKYDAFVGLDCGGCGSPTGGPNVSVNDIKSIKETKNELTLEVYYENVNVFTNEYTGISYYHFARFSVESNNPDLLKQADEVSKEIKEKYLDKVDVYTVKFTKSGNDYIFKSLNKKLS